MFKNISIVGCGLIGSSILRFLNKEKLSDQINIYDKSKEVLSFLKENKLSKLYAYGSYFYLLYKAFNFKDLNFNLFIAYIIYYPYYFILKIFNIFLINFIKKN